MGSDELTLEFATEGAKITFRDAGMLRKFREGKERTLRNAYIVAQRSAPEVEGYMKTNAPWTDRTGNARSGLFARAYQEGDEVGIDLGHSVFYGIFLEAKFNGRDAIIQPTIDAMGPVVMRRFDRLMERL